MARTVPQTHKLARLAARKLTRAHLGLAQRPTLRDEMGQAAARIAEVLGKRVGATVELAPRLLESAVQGSDSFAFPAAFALFSLDEVGGYAILEMPAQLCSALVDRLAGGAGEPAAPLPLSEAEEAGTSLLLLDVLGALRESPAEKALAPRLVRIVHAAAELCSQTDLRQKHLALRVRVTCEKVIADCRVLIPASALRFWLEATAAEALPLDAAIGAVVLPFSVHGGRAALGIDDLEGLVEGDVVLLEGLRSAGEAVQGEARWVGIGFAMSGHIGSDGFQVEKLEVAKEKAMNDKTQVTRAADLPVQVEVELCRVNLTLAELGAIQPGGVVPLRIGAGEPVQLKVGEQVVAVAELVDIEGEIGARILRMCK